MVNVFRKIKNILIGTYRNIFKINKDYVPERMRICDACEHNKCLMKNITYCEMCGCVIDSKVRVKDEKCSINKW